MNTPATSRDVLLARHAATVQPVLDAQREALLARFAAAPTSASASASAHVSVFSLRGVFEALWRELFVPCRGAWAAFACLWVAILAFDRLNTAASTPEHATEIARSDAAWLAVWLQQRRLLVELARDPFAPAATPPLAIPAPAVPPLGCIDFSVNALRHA